MCILFFYINPNPVPGSYRVVIASNRDEVYSRPSKEAHQWTENSDIFGGVDLQPGKEGGTWLALNKKGRIGILLNVGQNREINSIDEKSGRGFYVVKFVSNFDQPTQDIFDSIKDSCNVNSQPFKLVTFNFEKESPITKCAIFSHMKVPEESFSVDHIIPGVYGIGNNACNLSWNKVKKGEETLSEIMNRVSSWVDKEDLLQELLNLLNCKDRHWPDAGILEQLSQKPAVVLECLSSVFVEIPVANYGTRSQTVILVNYENDVLFYERSLNANPKDGSCSATWNEKRFEFQLDL